MKFQRRLSQLLLNLAFATALPALASAQVTPRSVYVSVLDDAGVPVDEFGPSDVIVREDNVSREVLRVVPADEPMQIAVLVDNSQAAGPFIRDYRQALPAFIAELSDPTYGGGHQVAIVAVAERPTMLTDYTVDQDELRKGVDRLYSMSGSGSYLLDGIIEISRGLEKRGARRPVIVAISTEGPELSERHFDQVLKPLRESGAALHVIVLGNWSDQSYDRSHVLEVGPRETGGSRTSLFVGSALTNRLKQLGAELSRQFQVTYARPQSLIPPERVTVTTARPGLTVRGTTIAGDRDQVGP